MILQKGIFLCFLVYSFAWTQVNTKVGAARAKFFGGASYDLLRDPTYVNFDSPTGYLSLNIPFKFEEELPAGFTESIDPALRPSLGAEQKLNLSFRIDVPMMAGVGSFGMSDNVDVGYEAELGDLGLATDTSLCVTGAATDTTCTENFLNVETELGFFTRINVPIRYRMNWRSQSFGYAMKPVGDLVLAFNMHRHVFSAKGVGSISSVVGGQIKLNTYTVVELPGLDPSVTKATLADVKFNFDDVGGYIQSSYEASAWSPAFGFRWKWIGAQFRMGVTKDVKGTFEANYAVPFFINPKTFEVNLSAETFSLGGDTDSTDTTAAAIDPLDPAASTPWKKASFTIPATMEGDLSIKNSTAAVLPSTTTVLLISL